MNTKHLLNVIICSAFILPATGQNEERIAELEASLAELKLEAEIATNRKTAREATFGETVAPLEGTITIDSSAEATIVAHGVLDRIAEKIAADMMKEKSTSDAKGAPIIVESPRFRRIAILSGQPDGALKGALEAHRVITNDLTALNSDLQTSRESIAAMDRSLNAPDPAALTGRSFIPAMDAAQAALSLAALFRTDSNFKGVAMTANQAAFVATLANSIRSRSDGKITISTSLFASQDSTVRGMRTLYHLLQNNDRKRQETEGAMNSLKATVKKLDGRSSALDKQKSDLEVIIGRKESTAEEVQAAKENLTKVEADIKAFNEKFGDRIDLANARIKEAEVLVKRSAEYGDNLKKGALLGIAVEKLIQAEGFQQFIERGAAILFVNVNYLGGTNLGKRNLLTNTFRSSGGASVSYQLIGTNLNLIQSNTYYSYDGFYKVDDRKVGNVHGNIDPAQPPQPAKRKLTPGPRSR